MAYNVPKFLKRAEDSLLFNQDGEFIFYVPELYFDRGNATPVGEFINIIGILDYAIFDANGKSSGLKRFFFPTVFLTKPCEIRLQKNIKLKEGTEPSDYRLLVYHKDDVIVVSTKVPQDVVNIENFFRVLFNGKLPTTIPYDKLQEYFIECAALNGMNFGITLQLFGTIISEICRDKNNLYKPFRLTNYTDPTSYRVLSIKDVPKYIAPSSSISSENWDNAVVGAIMNPSDTDSPMEVLLMGRGD